MAASQSHADLAEKKRKLMMSKIKDVWQSQLSIVFEDVCKVMPVAIDIGLKGLQREEEYTIPRHGTDVIIISKICSKTIDIRKVSYLNQIRIICQIEIYRQMLSKTTGTMIEQMQNQRQTTYASFWGTTCWQENWQILYRLGMTTNLIL